MTQATEAPRAEEALAEALARRYPVEAARALAGHGDEAVGEALERLSLESAVGVLEHLDPDLATTFLEGQPPEATSRFLSSMDAPDAAQLLARMEEPARATALAGFAPLRRRELEDLLSHAPETAGSLMDPRVTTFQERDTAGEALRRIRQRPGRRVIDVCVVDEAHRLVGTVSLQDLAIADPEATLDGLTRADPVTVPATADREEVVDRLESSDVASMPVVDFHGRLLGIIRHDSLVQAAQQEATESLQAMVGAGREERALSKPSLAIRKRLPWLQVNLATAFLAAAVVGAFEDTIARFTALAVLLPVVAGQSGNTGAQALAVTMRGLALREIRIGNWGRVAAKELLVCFVNGCAVACTTSALVWLWSGSFGIPAVLAVSMVVSMVMAGLAGATIPVVLTALGQDPAQSASIVLTTVTDVVGFLSFLGFATIAADVLNIAL